MTKIMLVEDDKSLREIYGVRLLAEGYDIVSAGDGEEALAIAIKERPQLIISDVMMPKVSGYDMLDILRSTSETKNIRVIMMTALSSEEQRTRAESLGADRYLVKSQVGIEDVVRVVHEVLEDRPETVAAGAAAPVPNTSPAPPAAPASPPPSPSPAPGTVPPVLPPPANPIAVSTPPAASGSSVPKPASLKDRVIQPLNDPMVSQVNLNDLLDKELAKEAGLSEELRPPIASTEQSKAIIEEQMKSFSPPSVPLEPVVPPELDQIVASAQPTTSSLPTPGINQPVPPATPPVPNPQTAAPAAPSPEPTSLPQPPVMTAQPPTAPVQPAMPTGGAAPQSIPVVSPSPSPTPVPPSPPSPAPDIPAAPSQPAAPQTLGSTPAPALPEVPKV